VLLSVLYWRYCYFPERFRILDYANHLRFIREGKIPPYPLFHYCTLLFSGFDHARLPAGATISMALATCLTMVLSALFLQRNSRVSVLALLCVCTGLALAQHLPSPELFERMFERDWWFGTDYDPRTMRRPWHCKVSPNDWSNPTTMFSMPLAIAVSWYAAKMVRHASARSALVLALLMSLSVLAKPNYVLAFLPCFLFQCVVTRMPVRYAAIVPVLPLLAVAGEAVLLGSATKTKLLVSPFDIWQYYSTNIPFTVMLGTAFPFAVLLSYRGAFADETHLKLAWCALGMAILQFSILREDGLMAFDGNWNWAMILTDYVLFLSSCEFLLRQERDWRRNLCFAVLAAHAGAGAAYFVRTMVDPVRMTLTA
jgi:hypothetical protein